MSAFSYSLFKAVFVEFGFVLPNWMHGKPVLQALTNQIVVFFGQSGAKRKPMGDRDYATFPAHTTGYVFSRASHLFHPFPRSPPAT